MNTVYAQFEEIAKKYPDETAIIENDRTFTFSQLSALTDKICARFSLPLHNIGIVMSHGAEMIAAMFAVLKCGGCYVPAEPSFPKGRIDEMFGEAKVDFVITEREFAPKFGDYDLFLIDDIYNEEPNTPRACRSAEVFPDTPAYILYTSGTTGRPKGVCVSNGNVCYYARAFDNEFKPSPGDVMLQYSVCTFDIFVEEVFAVLLNGAAIAIPSEEQKEDIKTLIKFIDKNKVSIISGFPYLFEEINKNGEFPASLGLFLSGGDVLRASYIDNVPNRIQVYNTYGPSETTVCAAYYNCVDGPVSNDGTYPIGAAVLGAEIKILDKDGKEVKKGETGEITISGEGVSLGYIGDREAENRAFVTLEDGTRMYKTGDLGYELKNGDIVFLHRKDTQIMINGKRVETAEVQTRLYEIGGIEQAVVRAFKDERGLFYMTAYVVSAETDITVSDIRKKLAEHLPDYMIPEFFVKLSDIPKNENGKPDGSKLPVVMK